MTDNVVAFPEPDRYVFLCGNCDCQSFRLYADGAIECANCDQPICDHHGWAKELPPIEPEKVTRDDAETLTVRALGNVELARRTTLKEIVRWSETGELAMVSAYNVKGGGKHWVDVTTNEQRDWALRKLDLFRDAIAKIEIKE